MRYGLLTHAVRMTFQSTPCACAILTLFAYYRVSINSIFMIFHPVIGSVFIVNHVYFVCIQQETFRLWELWNVLNEPQTLINTRVQYIIRLKM